MTDNARITELPQICLVGPQLPPGDASAFVWKATLGVVGPSPDSPDKSLVDRSDTSLVNSTMGMRVLLQSPEKDRGPDVGNIDSHVLPFKWKFDLRLRAPHLLLAVALPKTIHVGLQPIEPKLSLEGGGVVSSSRLYPYSSGTNQGSAELIVVPQAPWPMPQQSAKMQTRWDDILVPWLRLAEGRLKVVLDANDAPFLRYLEGPDKSLAYVFVPDGAMKATVEQVPHLEVPLVPDPTGGRSNRFIAIDLTPDGIEIESSIGHPSGAGRVPVVVRLVHRPGPLRPSKSSWSLELARDSSDMKLRSYLQGLRRLFTAAPTRVFDLDLDTTRDIPAIRWPLEIVPSGGLAFATKVDGSQVDGLLEIDGDAARARLIGTPVEGGELPTVVMISPDRVEVRRIKDETTVRMDADRRPPAAASAAPATTPSPVAGPNATIDWQWSDDDKTSVKLAVEGGDSGQMVPWYLDEDELAHELLARYGAAGVHPANAATTYAFMPLRQGWLQWPVSIPDPLRGGARSSATDDPIAFDGPLEFAIPGRGDDSPRGRRVALLAADYIKAIALVEHGRLVREDVNLRGAAGQSSGLLWFATSSPSALEILPQLRAGPVALASPWLTFGRARSVNVAGQRPLWTQKFTFGEAYALTIAPQVASANARPDASANAKPNTLPKAIVWLRSNVLPVVSAIAMTRTADSAPDPLVTRDLVPRALDISSNIFDLWFTSDSGVPRLTYHDKDKSNDPDTLPLLAADVWSQVPLVPVTLAGIQFRTDANFLTRLGAMLRHDLPILDELFAKAKLPEKAPVSTGGQITIEPAPRETPTSLEPEALERAWSRARDQLLLSHTQSATAVDYPAPGADQPWTQPQANVTGLFEPAVWKLKSAFTVESTMIIDGHAYAFGQFELDDDSYSGPKALAGLNARFQVEGATLTRNDALDAKPVRVVGFATALWNSSADEAAPDWRDTRGAIAAALAQTEGRDSGHQFILRKSTIILQAGNLTRWRATAVAPIEIEPPDAAKDRSLALWFRDLPLSSDDDVLNQLEFAPDVSSPELAIGPDPSAFDSDRLPFAAYEWRFCNDPAGAARLQGRAEYDVAIGPFLFCPLRLHGIRFERSAFADNYLPKTAQVVGLLAPPGSTASPNAAGPFGPDRAYAIGNLVKVELKPSDKPEQLSFKKARWSPFAVPAPDGDPTSSALEFRLSELDVSLEGSTESEPATAKRCAEADLTTANLALDLADAVDESGRPVFKSASLDVILFGSIVRFSKGTVRYEPDDELVLEFSSGTSTDAGTCIKLDGATLRWPRRDTAKPRLWLRGSIVVVMADSPGGSDASLDKANARSLVELDFPGLASPKSLRLAWCNFIGGGVVSTEIDHARGVIQLRAVLDAASRQEPLAGLVMPKATVEARLTIAVHHWQDPKTGVDVLRGVSGFGNLMVSEPSGDVTRFQHTIRSPAAADPANPVVWLSDIELDFKLSRMSRIHWPVLSLPDPAQRDALTARDGSSESIADLAQRATGRKLRGTIGTYDASRVLRHRVTLAIRGARMPTATLDDRRDNTDTLGLARPWHVHVLARHELTQGGDEGPSLSWTSMEHVGFLDARGLAESSSIDCRWPPKYDDLAHDSDFTFAARSAEIDPSDPTYGREYSTPDETRGPAGNTGAAIRNGLIRRALAHAGFPIYPMARYLADGTVDGNGVATKEAFKDAQGNTRDGLVLVGGSPSVVRIDGIDPTTVDPQGVMLSLPWIATVEDGYDFGVGDKKKLAAFRQASPTEPADWEAPDVDWAAGSPMPISRLPSQHIGLRTARAAEIRAALNRAVLGPTSISWTSEVRALAPVEQAFPSLAASRSAIELPDRPLWLRTLAALRTIWERVGVSSRPFQSRVTSLVPSGYADARFARIGLSTADDVFEANADAAPVPADSDKERSDTPALFVAIGTTGTIATELPPLEARAIDVGDDDVAIARSRLVARAYSLVSEALGAVVLQNPKDPVNVGWVDVQIPADLEDPHVSIPRIDPLSQRHFASAALGWPTRNGTAAMGFAASGSLGMGDDRPFQDRGPDPYPDAMKDNDTVGRYGSGLSGRSVSLSLGARAGAFTTNAAAGASEPKVSTDAPVFFTLGRKMIFERPSDLPLVCPPARHLMPTSARIVTPVARELDAALSRVVRGNAATIVPAHVERTTFGLRPGAMEAEFDALVFNDGKPGATDEDMDAEYAQFGRPGHAGPMLTRQIRPPRGPGLPRLPLHRPNAGDTFVESHGRRTYVCVDDSDQSGRFARPFRLFDGVATIVRRGKDDSQRSFQIRVNALPLQPYGDDNGALTLTITCPSLSKAEDVANELAKLGLLRAVTINADLKGGVSASLAIDSSAWPYSSASYATQSDKVTLTFQLAGDSPAIGAINAALEKVDGDTTVSLIIRCARDNEDATPPATPFPLVDKIETGQDRAPKTLLEPETRRTIVLPLTVQPRGRATMQVGISTLVFGDPAYDRELSGPGAADVQRDNSGIAWKLALDRIEYGLDTPVYFAFGAIDAKSGEFAKNGMAGALSLARNPAPGRDGPGKFEDLTIADIDQYDIQPAQAYGVTLDRLRGKDGVPVRFQDGDQLIVTVRTTTADKTQSRTLSARATVVPRPVTAPPPAVYSLVVPYEGDPAPQARVALHATAPLPQKIEFPDLVRDLALGHIRRRALFEWRTAKIPGATTEQATLIKIDRAGGGQLPEWSIDIQSEM
jgi:hypothetical protein